MVDHSKYFLNNSDSKNIRFYPDLEQPDVRRSLPALSNFPYKAPIGISRKTNTHAIEYALQEITAIAQDMVNLE